MFTVDNKQSLKEALIKLAERPALFVGTEHFDALTHFFAGWEFVAHVYPWASNYDMQRWIFLRESVSIYKARTLHGHSLIQRCYGNRRKAIDAFKTILEDIEFNHRDDKALGGTVSDHIWQIYTALDGDGFFWGSPKSYNAIKPIIDEVIGEVQQSYEGIIPVINRIITETYDDLWVYLHYERYFLCVKFLYHTQKEGWKENIALVNQEDYILKLAILHAYATFVQKEDHSNHIITLRHHQGLTTVDAKEVADDWHDIFNNGADISICDNNPFCKSYAEWQAAILSQFR